MSAIGMQEDVCSADEFSLVRTVGSAFGEIFDCDGEHVLNVPPEEMEAAEKAFPTIVAMYRKGFVQGSFNGRNIARCEMRKALGL
jgi:hypothetical protein